MYARLPPQGSVGPSQPRDPPGGRRIGLLQALREHAATADAQHAEDRYQSELRAWEVEGEALSSLIELSTQFDGLPDGGPLQLHAKESCYFTLTAAQLLEVQRAPGHRVGGYAGPSFRVAKGVYWHMGAICSHYVPGVEQLQPVDTRWSVITDQLVVFIGGAQTREFQFAKLVSYQHHPDGHYTTLSVSNRQRPSSIRYENINSWCFRLDLAHAHFTGEVDQFVSQLRQELADHQSQSPSDPEPGSPPLPGARLG